MNEFALIESYFKTLSERTAGARCDLGIGDDAALVTVPLGKQLAVTADTLVSGVHFPVDTLPFDIGYKALAVNLSDLAAMGARPAWFTLCLTLPQFSDPWLQGFCAGLETLMREIPVTLIGGDTTRGPLSITIQAMGLVDSGCALRRDGAKPGDDIFVSGCVGDAGVGLRLVMQNSAADQLALNATLHTALNTAQLRLNRPLPRNALGAALGAVASSCIDISDGLLADLGHILTASHAGADVDVNTVPISPALLDPAIVAQLGLPDSTPQGARRFALSAGDDYELCFTAAPDQREQVMALAQQAGISVTRVGTVTAQPGIFDLANGGVMLTPAGYSHF